jgi:hypothetical protein
LTRIAAGAVALLGALFVMSPEQANARFSGHSVAAPHLTENVACTTRRVRTVRPNGTVVVRNVQTCTPECRMVRERTRLPNGNVIVRNVWFHMNQAQPRCTSQ